MTAWRALIAFALVGCVLAGCSDASSPGTPRLAPIVIAHRGASGERPEHTLAAYELAIAQGADFIEPDLVMTRDGVLVVRHDEWLEGTTDVASRPGFAARRERRPGQPDASGWSVAGFTREELAQLRAVERMPELRPGSAEHDGQYTIPSFDEVLELARAHGVGIYPELKHPQRFRDLGLPMEGAFLTALERYDLVGPDSPVIVQCFDFATLERLRARTRVRLTWLLDPERAGPPSRAELARVARVVDGIGPHKDWVLPRDAAGRLAATPTSLVDDAHSAGLFVHAWTFRAENRYLPAELRAPGGDSAHGDLDAEIRRFLASGVDGFFTDFPSRASATRDASASDNPAR